MGVLFFEVIGVTFGNGPGAFFFLSPNLLQLLFIRLFLHLQKYNNFYYQYYNLSELKVF